ncbi:MAG: UDP-N-acetylglucosamine 1-carboxyvinyltransferase [Verrucomicrobia bacterium]|nr:UDP-N-acetylglucosamine 1-carboxyvinyltransferase [Verrucomicrobiota bacterium]MDA1064968.1 UDP-N-acetylglucosamine 1-carboxyvinyltransferase [Verrucomicrobiota bacterium]
MDVMRIEGGHTLSGSISVSGAKNAALPIFAATLLTEETCILENVPNLSDIRFMAQILEHLGAEVEQTASTSWKITAKNISHRAPYDLVRKMRASVCLMGPLAGRLKKAEISLPGGCVIGPRPIDMHLKGFAGLGMKVEVDKGYVFLDAKEARGNPIFLGGRHGSTVTGTANVLMAAVLTPGKTVIECAACEPEVVDLCKMLVSMGADIQGIGSPTLTIVGVEKLGGCQYSILPDRIEAGTFLIAGAMAGDKLTVTNLRAADQAALIDKLREAGVPLSIDSDSSITVSKSANPLKPVDVVTHPHPGFPTDIQAQMCTLMSVTPGISIVTEKIFPNRFMHVPELQRMGADIAIEGPNAIVKGQPRLSGAPVMASDLRASAALILAGLVAEGTTWVLRIYHLDRGYDKIDEKLRAVGAVIDRIPESEMPKDLNPEVA